MVIPEHVEDNESVVRVLRDPQGFLSRRKKHTGEPFQRSDVSPLMLFRPEHRDHDSSLIRDIMGTQQVKSHARDVPNALALVYFTAGDARTVKESTTQALDVVDDRNVYEGHASLTLPSIRPEEFPGDDESMSDELRHRLKSIYEDLFELCRDPVLISADETAGG